MIGFLSSRTGELIPLEFMVDGAARQVTLPSRITVNGANTMAVLARMGFGLIQAPRYRFDADFARGTLVEVLPEHPPSPTPFVALYPQKSQLSSRVRVFLDWVSGLFTDLAR